MYYNPLNSGLSFQQLENAILAINHVSTPTVLLGDFNVNLLDITNTVTTNLSSSMLGFGFTQLIQQPTRVSKSSTAIIDHVYVSPTPITSDTATTLLPPLGSSDHNCILVALPLKVKLKPTKRSRKVWLYKHAVLKDINTCLQSTLPQIPDKGSVNIDDAWQEFYSAYMGVMKAKIPSIFLSSRRYPPWLTTTLKTCFERRDKAHWTAKESNCPNN